jgi:hypothetical protein
MPQNVERATALFEGLVQHLRQPGQQLLSRFRLQYRQVGRLHPLAERVGLSVAQPSENIVGEEGERAVVAGVV